MALFDIASGESLDDSVYLLSFTGEFEGGEEEPEGFIEVLVGEVEEGAEVGEDKLVGRGGRGEEGAEFFFVEAFVSEESGGNVFGSV